MRIPAHRRYVMTALFLAGTALLAACSSASTPPASGSAAPSGAAAPATSAAPAATAAGAGSAPHSCGAVPSSIISGAIGPIGTTQSLPSPNGISCEYANTSMTRLLVLNMGPSTPAAFGALRTISGKGGRTVTPVSGLGSQAFAVTKNGVPAGETALTTGGVVISVVSNIPLAKDSAVIRQLMKQL